MRFGYRNLVFPESFDVITIPLPRSMADKKKRELHHGELTSRLFSLDINAKEVVQTNKKFGAYVR